MRDQYETDLSQSRYIVGGPSYVFRPFKHISVLYISIFLSTEIRVWFKPTYTKALSLIYHSPFLLHQVNILDETIALNLPLTTILMSSLNDCSLSYSDKR